MEVAHVIRSNRRPPGRRSPDHFEGRFGGRRHDDRGGSATAASTATARMAPSPDDVTWADRHFFEADPDLVGWTRWCAVPVVQDGGGSGWWCPTSVRRCRRGRTAGRSVAAAGPGPTRQCGTGRVSGWTGRVTTPRGRESGSSVHRADPLVVAGQSVGDRRAVAPARNGKRV